MPTVTPIAEAPKKAEPSLEDSITQMEERLEEAIEREVGLETLLSVMQLSDEFSEAQRDDTEANLDRVRREVAELEYELDGLHAAYDAEHGARSSMSRGSSTSSAATTPGGRQAPRRSGSSAGRRDVASIKEAVRELNAKVEELEAELAMEKKQAAGARKLADLVQLSEDGRIQMAEVEAEASRHQSLIMTKELFISGLRAEREGLLAQVPDDVDDAELQQELQRDVESAEAEAEQHGRAAKRAEKRANIVRELVATDDEYVEDLKLCVRGYMEEKNAVTKQTVFDGKRLFGNFMDVKKVAEALAARLADECSLPLEQQEIGKAFCQNAKGLQAVYVEYCCNFDDASALLNEYMLDPAKKTLLAACHENVAAFTKCWDLNSFLIKPVQRILKYPLLLNELIQNTDSSHPDHAMLIKAAQCITGVAQEINEGKRRKELVDKYKAEVSKGSGVRLDRLNLHSLSKKSMRLNQKLFHRKGKDGEDNQEFYRQEKRVRAMEKAARALHKKAQEYVDAISRVYDLQKELATHIRLFYSETPRDVPEHVRDYFDAATKVSEAAKEFEASVDARVTQPIGRLLLLFKNPFYLIDKRRAKKLDYDSFQRQYSKSKVWEAGGC